MSNLDKSQSDPSKRSRSRIHGILKPLEQKGDVGREYIKEMHQMVEMDRRFRSIEFLYGAAYAQVIDLEKKIATMKETKL